jgi:hypothetical protein
MVDYMNSFLSAKKPTKQEQDEMKNELAVLKVVNCAKSDAGGFKCAFEAFYLPAVHAL